MAFAFVMKLGHVNVRIATSTVTYNDVAFGFSIDRMIIIRVNACCVAASSERTQQIPTVAVSKIRIADKHYAQFALDMLDEQIFQCDRSRLAVCLFPILQ
jgi:hypothetical protein